MEAPRGAREPTGTNGPTLNNHPTNKPGWANQETVNTLPQPLYKPRSTHTPPNKHGGRVLNTKLVVVIAPGKRPATFRTWKLSPAAPMVLQPPGCGRVGHRHNTPQRRASPTQVRPSTHLNPLTTHPAEGLAMVVRCAGACNVHGTCVLNDRGFVLVSGPASAYSS